MDPRGGGGGGGGAAAPLVPPGPYAYVKRSNFYFTRFFFSFVNLYLLLYYFSRSYLHNYVSARMKMEPRNPPTLLGLHSF